MKNQNTDRVKEAIESAEELASRIKEAGENILDMGLGALSKRQEETSKVFNELVKRGRSLEEQAKKTLEHQYQDVKNKVNERVAEAKQKTRSSIEQIEQSLSENVSSTIEHLGQQTNEQMQKLNHRVEELERALEKVTKKLSK